MPIYEYQCQGCAHEFETIQKFSDPVLERCPQCGKDLLKKKMSAVAFRLKGGGWYETDFKAGDKRNVARGDEGGESSSSDAAAKPAAAESNVAATKSSGAAGGGASDGGGRDKPAKESAKPAAATPKTDTAKPAKGESKSD